MLHIFRKRFLNFLIFFVFSLFFSAFHVNFPLDINGYIARKEISLIILVFSTMLIVVLPVLFFTIFFAYKYRSSNFSETFNPNWSHSYFLEILIWIIPIFIVFFLSIITWVMTNILEPSKPIFSEHKPIVIEVVSLDWKWLFIYPKYKIATINKLVIPKNIPIKFKVTSYSVMNSFFIPSLGSQIYSMAGMKTELNLISNKTGICHGISANYSGKGFSDMKFIVLTVNNEENFLNWIKSVRFSKKILVFKEHLLKLVKKTWNNKIQYFSYIDPAWFNKIVHLYKEEYKI